MTYDASEGRFEDFSLFIPSRGRFQKTRRMRHTTETCRRHFRAIFERTRPVCPGCLQRFDPVRPGQRHCRPSCIAAEADRRRGAGNLFDVGVSDARM
jgi:hypothetical protein